MRSAAEPAPAARVYFGWLIVAAASLITLLTVGLRMGIGPFFIPVTDTLGMSRTTLAAIIALSMLVYGLGMPLAGHLAQRYGTARVLLLGTALIAGASVWAVSTTSHLGFLLSFGVLLSLGTSFTSPVALTPIISRWFTRQRGKALFFLSTGSMAGIAIMTPLLALSIKWFSWQATLIGFAVLFAIVVVPVTLVWIRDDAPENTDLRPGTDEPAAARTPAPLDGLGTRDAVRTVPFWQVAFALFACGFSMNLIGTHGVPMLVDHGFTELTASTGIGVIGLVAIGSSVVLGSLADRVPRPLLLALVFLVRAIGFVGLVVVTAPWFLYSVAVIGGLAWAGSLALSSAIMGDVYGVRSVGVLYGWVFLAHQVGATVSSFLGGWAFEQFHTHWIAYGTAIGVLAMACVVSLRLPRQRPQGTTAPAPEPDPVSAR